MEIEGRIRPKAVCICRRGESILVASAYDSVKQETFYGPPGGGIEFGERAEDAVRREMFEELGVALRDVRLLGVLENIFTYEGASGHEITFVFEASLEDRSLYSRDEIDGIEGKHPFVARWVDLDEFGADGPPLYPQGLLALLKN